MKTKINSLLFIPLFAVIISCANNKSANDLLDDPEQQEEVLTAIANDSTLLAKLHDKMMSSGKMNMMGNNSMMRSCMAMMDNPEMMNTMMDYMMMKGENDSTMGKMMCDKMMNSSNMKSMMKGMMDKEQK